MALFRIPGHTVASEVKPTKVRLMQGRNELTRDVLVLTNSIYLKLANVRLLPFPQDNANTGNVL